MNEQHSTSGVVPQASVLPRWWRLTLIALASLILTACSAFDPPSSRGGRNSLRVPADTANPTGSGDISDSASTSTNPIQQTAYHEAQHGVAGKMTPAAAQLPPQAFTGEKFAIQMMVRAASTQTVPRTVPRSSRRTRRPRTWLSRVIPAMLERRVVCLQLTPL